MDSRFAVPAVHLINPSDAISVRVETRFSSERRRRHFSGDGKPKQLRKRKDLSVLENDAHAAGGNRNVTCAAGQARSALRSIAQSESPEYQLFHFLAVREDV